MGRSQPGWPAHRHRPTRESSPDCGGHPTPPAPPPAPGGEAEANTIGAGRARAPKIIADERTNSLIVVADEDTTARVRALVS